MLVLITVENGVKKIIPLTADAGAGNPVGTIIVVCSNQIPSNYLPLGAQYDTSLYPVLYALLGTDTTPTASALGLPTLTSGQYAIKATSGLSENAQDNVINTLNEQRSYSTEEVNTGKKWIDGKDIYSNVVVVDSNINNHAAIAEVPIDTIVSYSGMIIAQDGNLLPLPWVNANVNESFSVYYVPTENKLHVSFSMTTPTKIIVSIEYTKTV